MIDVAAYLGGPGGAGAPKPKGIRTDSYPDSPSVNGLEFS